jgi:hypothetical protein
VIGINPNDMQAPQRPAHSGDDDDDGEEETEG